MGTLFVDNNWTTQIRHTPDGIFLLAFHNKTNEKRRYKVDVVSVKEMLDPMSIQEPYEIWDEGLGKWVRSTD